MNERIVFEAADDSNSAAVLQLLSEAGLPTDGVVEHLDNFILTRNGSAEVIGVSGVERYGKTGLLRSVAVAADWQKSGVGSQMVAEVLRRAQMKGVEEIILLTMTERDFFARRFGFSETVRERYDEILRDSAEWNLPRCSSAVVMRLDLHGENFETRFQTTSSRIPVQR